MKATFENSQKDYTVVEKGFNTAMIIKMNTV